MNTTRRTFLAHAAAGLGTPLLVPEGFDRMLGLTQPRSAGDRKFVGLIPFVERRRRTEPHKPYGTGLGGRQRVDLSTLKEGELITPADHFYIRTRCPAALDTSKPWAIRVRGLVEREYELPLEDLLPLTKKQGAYLLECSGSGTGGLISACDWSGIPIEDVLSRCGAKGEATHIKISGFDEHPAPRRGRDNRGCDWVFTAAQLREAGAFLATHMNGERITRDHGYPVRLLVPGWYGCTCVKWLDEIAFVDDKTPSTPHMIEFAGRTLQKGRPKLAKEFRPSYINLSAMAVRIEQWRAENGEIEYDVVGIVWGGRTPAKRLAVRFNRDEVPVPVEGFEHRTTRTWNLWRHTWRPKEAGRYRIRCSFPKVEQATRKVDSGYFDRTVRITAV